MAVAWENKVTFNIDFPNLKIFLRMLISKIMFTNLVILGVEALISGRILHESCPAWFHGFLAFIFIIPLFLPGF